MLRNKIVILPGLIVMVMVMTIGCYKTTTIVKNPGSEITKEMSFSKDIVPIFEKSCAANSGCHGAGAKTPNLTASAAYKALTDGSYIKAGDADNSVLILWLTGKKSPVMPLGAGPNQDINAQVYAWIAQGAKNN
jgi:hypothetical protein